MRSLLTILALFCLWLVMSGIYKPLIVILGLISAVVCVWVVRRMDDAADSERLVVDIKPFALAKYLGWLMVEIAKSNWAVTKIILSPKMEMNSKLFRVQHTQRTDLGQAIFANSITLTPGTVSVEVERDHFLVHALCYSDGDTEAIADMDARVTKTEAA